MEFKKGYLLVITSYENDADNSKELRLMYQDKESILFVKHFLDATDKHKLQNLYEPKDEFITEAFLKVLEDMIEQHSLEAVKGFFCIEEDLEVTDEGLVLHPNLCWDILQETLAYYLGSSDFFTRYLEEFSVFEIPFDITFKDVTSEIL